MTITFFGLAEVTPALRQFETAGRQAASTGWHGWLSWLATFREFTKVVEEAAQASGVSFGETRRVVLDHLAALYQHERHRLTPTTDHQPDAARAVHRPRASRVVPLRDDQRVVPRRGDQRHA